MGWSGGSDLFGQVIDVLQPVIKSPIERKNVYKKLIKAFGSHDWDTEGECLGVDKAYDKALKELYPHWFEDEEEDEADDG